MQLYWPHLIAVTHTTATILEQSKIVALVCAALSMEPIEGVTHSTATILPFLPLLVLFWIDNPNQMLKNINSISVWQFWLNKVGSNVSLRHLNWWLKIKSFNLDLLSLCPSKILAVVRVTNAVTLCEPKPKQELRNILSREHVFSCPFGIDDPTCCV